MVTREAMGRPSARIAGSSRRPSSGSPTHTNPTVAIGPEGVPETPAVNVACRGATAFRSRQPSMTGTASSARKSNSATSVRVPV